jgi:hypothetical protein
VTFARVRVAKAPLAPVSLATGAAPRAAPAAGAAAGKALSLAFQLPAGSLADVSAATVELKGASGRGGRRIGDRARRGRTACIVGGGGERRRGKCATHCPDRTLFPPLSPAGSLPHQLLFGAGAKGVTGGDGVAFKGAPTLRDGKAKT